MDRKSTPGPWDIERTEAGDWAIVAGPDDKEIAIFYGEDDDGKRWPVVGNAKLAALAPEMEAIIKRLCNQFACAGVLAQADSNNPIESLHGEAHAILAKLGGI